MSEKLSCGIVQDLLPLVIDDVAGDDSKTAVQEHLAVCPECTRIYEQLLQADPSPVVDAQSEQHFRLTMKRTRRRGILLKMMVAIMALMILVGGIMVASNPQMLLHIGSEVPVAWMQNAHLVRTAQGFVMLQFTPSEKYRRYFGVNNTYGEWRTEASGEGMCWNIHYGYPLMARLLDLRMDDDPKHPYLYQERKDRICLANGDWLVALTGFGTMYYDAESDCIVNIDWHDATADEIRSLMENGMEVTGNTQIAVIAFDSQTNTISLDGPDGQTVIYRIHDEIPMLDAASQSLFDQMLDANPHQFTQPGEIRVDGKG